MQTEKEKYGQEKQKKHKSMSSVCCFNTAASRAATAWFPSLINYSGTAVRRLIQLLNENKNLQCLYLVSMIHLHILFILFIYLFAVVGLWVYALVLILPSFHLVLLKKICFDITAPKLVLNGSDSDFDMMDMMQFNLNFLTKLTN